MFGLFKKTSKTVVLTGTLTGPELSSPINQRPCVAFYYRSTYQRISRGTGFTRSKLRDGWGFSDGLVLTDGEGHPISAVAEAVEAFTHADHLALKAGEYQGFIAREKRVLNGERVQLTGHWIETPSGQRLQFHPDGLVSLKTPK